MSLPSVVFSQSKCCYSLSYSSGNDLSACVKFSSISGFPTLAHYGSPAESLPGRATTSEFSGSICSPVNGAGPAKTFAGQPRCKTQEPRPAREVQRRPSPRRSCLQERRRTQECVEFPRDGESPGFLGPGQNSRSVGEPPRPSTSSRAGKEAGCPPLTLPPPEIGRQRKTPSRFVSIGAVLLSRFLPGEVLGFF